MKFLTQAEQMAKQAVTQPATKRITLFFEEAEYQDLVQTCEYLNAPARPFIKSTIVREMARLADQAKRAETPRLRHSLRD
jgi:hypothetical protein